MKMKLLTIGIVLITLVAPATAINIVDVNIQPSQPDIGDNIDLNATVDGEGKSVETVEYNLEVNDTLTKSGVLYDYSSGDPKDISNWIALDSITGLEANSSYEITTIATDQDGNVDNYKVILESGATEVEVEEQPLESDSSGFIDRLINTLGLNSGVFAKNWRDLTVGQIFIIVGLVIGLMWVWD